MTKVITYGTYDLFHEGHYKLLQRAKALGDYLIVGVTTEHFDENRGKLNVVDSLMDRIKHVQDTGFADQIIIEDHVGQKIEDIQKYHADIFVLGSDWVGKYDYLNEYCKVVYLDRTRGISSSMLRRKNYEIVRLGILGAGRIANRFIPESHYVSGIVIEGVYNHNLEKAQSFAQKHELAIATDNVEELFDKVNAVNIALPHEYHYEYAKKALEHGLHVLCEKPMALKKAEAEELFEIAKEKNLESLSTRLFPSYNHPDSVFLEEQFLYDTLSSEKLFHKMANSWLIECDAKKNKSDVLHVTSSLERGKENGFFTIIHDGGGTRWVEKRAAYAEGERHLRELESNAEDLKRHGIKVVDGSLASGSYRMPFISAEVGQLRLRRLFREDTEAFLRELDHFRDLILQSSEHEKEDTGDGNGVILRRGYFDMVPLNSFYIDGEYVFYDQEFFVEHYPANVMILRMVGLAYDSKAGRKTVDFPIERLYERYNLQKNLSEWQRMDWEFLASFRKDKELRLYHEKYRADGNVINLNRQRMNFSEEEYKRLFMDIFPEDGRPLVLFGSGRWAQKFMILYGKHCNVEAVIDNNENAWGGTMEGLPVESPETLLKRERNSFRVLICIKNYLSVLRQLSDMGVEDYRIFDGNKAYELPRSDKKNESKENGSDNKKKKYKVGYIAGVFDLFHIGHLNMFRRAKEQCEYLIVGVVSDEQVRKVKRVEPFVPFDERIEMVRSCRYVDEAHEIPFEYAGTREAWQMYHFDAQFSGSDYIDDNNWLAEKEFLHKHGAELVFFPYTEQTSSTKIKALIEKRLL